MAVPSTVHPPLTGRRVVRRARPTIDQASEQALPDLPPDLRVAIQLWVEARTNEWSARAAFSSVMTEHNYKWLEIEKLAREL
jgi:hypothetical protein